jgi:hypothetical protein
VDQAIERQSKSVYSPQLIAYGEVELERWAIDKA